MSGDDAGGVFGNLPGSRPGSRSPRRRSGQASAASEPRPKPKPAPSGPSAKPPAPESREPEPAPASASAAEDGPGGLEDVAWAGVAVAAEAATIGVRLASRALEALRGSTERSSERE